MVSKYIRARQRLHVDDIGSVVGQILDSYWPHADPRKVEDFQAFEWQRAYVRTRDGVSTCGRDRRNAGKLGEYLVVVLAQQWRASPYGNGGLAHFYERAGVRDRFAELRMHQIDSVFASLQLNVFCNVFHGLAWRE